MKLNYHPELVVKRTVEFEINSPQEVVTKIILDLENEMVHMKLRSNGLWVIEHFVHIDFGSKHGAGFPALHSA